ncbi:MAG: LysR family transcriptional regulator [Pseudomonadota bacterium]
MVDIKRLNHFLALAEEGRFLLAAKRVHLSQAAFSRSIQTLESQLGLRLFDRGAEGARLTPAGEVVLERARPLLFASRCLQRDIELIKSGDVGAISVGAAPIPAYAIVPEMLSRLREQSPQLMVRVRMGNLPTLLGQLDTQEIDFCLGDPRLVLPADPRYAMASLGQHTGGLYCRSGHPLARRKSIDAGVLKKYGVAMISITPAIRAGIAKNFGFDAVGSFPQVVECDDVHTLVRLLSTSDVLGVLPHTINFQSGQKLRRLHFAGAIDAHADVHAIWLAGRTLAPSAARAVKLAQEVSEALLAVSRRAGR